MTEAPPKHKLAKADRAAREAAALRANLLKRKEQLRRREAAAKAAAAPGTTDHDP